MPSKLQGPRGSALLVTVISIAVLLMLVVGAIRFTGSNREAAGSKARGDRVTACADTARRFLFSKLSIYQSPSKIQLNEVLLDQPGASDRSRMTSAHYSDPVGNTVVAVSAASMGKDRAGARDLSNVLVNDGTLGGQYFRVVVKCQEAAGRESELEFLFKYGL
jgi:hypothetical protein